jgi:hypothetical protein
MAFLAAKALDFSNRYSFAADFGQGVLNFLKLEGLDDGNNQFHEKKESSTDAKPEGMPLILGLIRVRVEHPVSSGRSAGLPVRRAQGPTSV